MATFHITEAEATRDLQAVLAKVRQGIEVIIEQNNKPVAVVRPPSTKGRLLSESIALAESRGSTAVLDGQFMADVNAGIVERSKAWNPPNWE